MILTNDGCVYGWGYNMFGHPYSSFAITSEGQVFSWGRNDWYGLGHNLSDNIWKPQLIADMTVVSEMSYYKSLYEELHSLGSGAFGEGNCKMDNPFGVMTIYGSVCKKCKNWLKLGQNTVSNISVNG
ncbi:unnamed protein product [Oppiella nova]|uniref:Uncharacterized protein n=1 Tax=Oppiella nova TaxID=334625 RepID=A0A7R9QXL8_9ACAR|nr:unnamed protein product [Oppiella nova]CAG2178652.1 unnamed protein product [Oppiella nova]